MHGHPQIGSNELTHINRAFYVGITLNILFVVVEFGSGAYLNSLALISDAGHNLSDVASLALALVAFKLAKIKPNQAFTYGYRKTTILVSLLNAVILLIVVGVIASESIARFQQEKVVSGDSMALVAGIGIFINAFTAFLFFKDRNRDLNIKGAYLHMAADALVSVGVVVTGLIIGFTYWYWLDTAVSLAIVVVIFLSTWGLLRDSVVLAIDGVPRGVNLEKITEEILKCKDVQTVHHIHVWAISTTENALTAHIVVPKDFQLSDFEPLKDQIKERLSKSGIQHSTLEVETGNVPCPDEDF